MIGRIARAVVLVLVIAAAVVACDRVVDLTVEPDGGFVPDGQVFPDGLPFPDAGTDSHLPDAVNLD